MNPHTQNKKLIIANWKMAPNTLAEAEGILEFINDYLESTGEKIEFSLVFCPPFVFINEVARILKTSHLEHQSSLGAQDIAFENKAALTGEISGPMLVKMGVEYVIIGHSERRWKVGEYDKVVNSKLKAALLNELKPVVCIGEKSRDGNFKEFLKNQVSATFEGLTADEVRKCIVAYEPVWAISSNPDAHRDTPESALESMRIIDQVLNSKFETKALNELSARPSSNEINAPVRNSKLLYLYGGSVNSSNIEEFLSCKEIDGVLVGGASVNKEEFARILKVIARI